MNSETASTRWRRAACRWLGRRAHVSVATCVHFGGFRYTTGSFNPYRDYVAALARGDNPQTVRERFVDFLQHHRPRDLGEALGLRLTRRYPLWIFPWSHLRTLSRAHGGWHENPAECPDLLTHFSEHGILRSRIEEEFGWLEQALFSIRDHGYNPQRFHSWIETRRLVHDDGSSAWLIEDGNHRLAVLSTLDTATVEVLHLPWRAVRRRNVHRWPLVRSKVFTPADAVQVFDVYFRDAPPPRRAAESAPILEVVTP